MRFVVDYKGRRLTKDLLFTRILEEIDRTDGVALASAMLELVGVPPLDIRTKENSKAD